MTYAFEGFDRDQNIKVGRRAMTLSDLRGALLAKRIKGASGQII